MNLKDLYSIKGVPIVTYTITAISLIMSCIVYFAFPEHFADICLQTEPEHIWQYFSGIFIHNIEPRWVMWVHMGMNFMGLLPLGIIVEKVLGSKCTFVLFTVETVVTAVLYQVVTWNNPGQACGISSITYAFAVVGFYCAWIALKRGKDELSQNRVHVYKQGLFWYFLFEGLGMLSMLNPMGSMTSFVLHISGVITGEIFAGVMRKRIYWRITQTTDVEV